MKVSSIASYPAVLTYWGRFGFSGGHTWLECTDYRFTEGTSDATVWNKDQCFGHARCGARQAAAGFGVDTGFNFHSGQGCQCGKAPDNYAGISMATYQPGQQVCLAYPPKTHVAAECTNAFIPDHGVVITRAPLYDDSSAVTSYQQLNGDHQSGVVDYKGFQHCPKFCEDIQGALCTMCFQLENDVAPGNYTFRWVWSFNSDEDAYSSCWEASILNAGTVTTPEAQPVDGVAVDIGITNEPLTNISSIPVSSPPSQGTSTGAPSAPQANVPTVTVPSSDPNVVVQPTAAPAPSGRQRRRRFKRAASTPPGTIQVASINNPSPQLPNSNQENGAVAGRPGVPCLLPPQSATYPPQTN